MLPREDTLKLHNGANVYNAYFYTMLGEGYAGFSFYLFIVHIKEQLFNVLMNISDFV